MCGGVFPLRVKTSIRRQFGTDTLSPVKGEECATLTQKVSCALHEQVHKVSVKNSVLCTAIFEQI